MLFNVINTISVDKYNETVVSLKSLSSFYENVDTANSYVKDFLYTENKDTLSKYEKHIVKAKEDMQVLKKAALSDDYFRIIMLENMLDNYQAIQQKLVASYGKDKENYTNLYNEFLRTEVLIEKTSGDYYNLITKAVNAQLDNLKLIKKTSIVTSFLLLGLLLFWLLHHSRQITTSFTRPIELLLKNIQRVKEGEYDLSQVSGTSLEMEELCDALTEMAYAIQRNIETTKEKAQLEKLVLEWKNETLKKEELLVQSELKMLQNQINPHFLFNTLNMIYKLTIQEGAENAADILIKTSHLLRYGLDKQNRLSDIKSEVEMLKNYIEIQTIRLGNRVLFDLQFENGDAIGNIPIPGMILQPLVE
ncbi:MAG: histidine kinase, partial [Longicatena sp.]